MKRSEKVVLSVPVDMKGEKVTEIEVRRPTVADEEDAMDMAIQMGKSENRITLEICSYAKVTGLKYDTIRSMDADDFVKIRAAYSRVVAPLELNEKVGEADATSEQQKSA